MTTWTLTLEEDPETGECVVPLPPEALADLGWNPGDTLLWTMPQNGGYAVVRKVIGYRIKMEPHPMGYVRDKLAVCSEVFPTEAAAQHRATVIMAHNDDVVLSTYPVTQWVTDEEIDDRVEAWHAGWYPEGTAIYQALGWTEAEYHAWVVDADRVPERPLPPLYDPNAVTLP